MLGNFQDEPGGPVADFEGVQDGWQLVLELDVHDGTDDGHNLSVGRGIRVQLHARVQSSCDDKEHEMLI